MNAAERLAMALAIGVGLGYVAHLVSSAYGVYIQCGLITWPFC